MFIFNVKYVFSDNRNTTWKANIACEKNDAQEAIQFLSKKLLKPIIIESISFEIEVHAITFDLQSKLHSMWNPEVKQTVADDSQTNENTQEVKIIKRRRRKK